MKRLFLLSLAVLLGANFCMAKNDKSKALTLATIHNAHGGSKYSYGDIVNILNTYKPDLICVEIRPQDFRQTTYLREMMLATTYGDINKIPVVPMDWWDEKNNDRNIRDSLSKIDSYARKLKMLDSLEQHNEILTQFTKKYGENAYKNNNLDMYFWNGKEYNDQNRESYRLSISVFGDSPFNLHCITRNANMLNNIKAGVQKYNAKRVIVLTGAEHKSFIDDSLKSNPRFEVLSVDNLKDIKPYDLSKIIEKERPQLYFAGKVDSSKVDEYYNTIVMPFVHAMNMDINYSLINLNNLPIVEVILKNWQADAPGAPRISYEWAWYNFLNKDYDAAIKCCNQYLASKDLSKQVFPDFLAYRIMGFCYDLKNDRANAVECYKKAKEIMVKANKKERTIKLFLADYENTPFTRVEDSKK